MTRFARMVSYAATGFSGGREVTARRAAFFTWTAKEMLRAAVY